MEIMSQIEKIIGYKKEVERLQSICDFLEKTDKYVEDGVKLPKCMLIYGQKGVGKTMMAEALAKDSARAIFRIDVKTDGMRKIERVFRAARKMADAIVLIDDVDYLNLEQDADVFELIDYEIDRCVNEEVFTILTADVKENLPKYLLRAIDHDMVIELNPPTIEEACVIFKPIFDKYNLEDDFNAMDFCCYAIDRTYSYVEEMFNKAKRLAVYEKCKKIAMRHLIYAGLWMRGHEPATEFDVGTAYHEVGHAVVHMLLGGDAGCIVLYGDCGGYFAEMNWKEDTYRDVERRYMVRIAGKVGEELYSQTISLGSDSDLKNLAEDLEKDAKVFATQGFEYFDPIQLNSPSYNDALSKKVQNDLQKYYDEVKALLLANMPLVEKMVEALKNKFYLLHSEIYEIYNAYKK